MTFTENNRASLLSSFVKTAFNQVDNSTLIIFRMVFGLLLCYYSVNCVLSGYVYKVFISPPFTFNFIGFDFLQPPQGRGMYYYFALMALSAFMIAAGAWYRLAAFVFCFLWTGIYLMQKTYYNNHYYLIVLLSFLLIFVPANQSFSIDVKRKAIPEKRTCPQWVFWLFIGQVAIVFFYAGIAKLNPDWLSGRFILIQFAKLSTYPVLGSLYKHRFFHLLICYGGILFDLFIVPLLLYKKTRRAAFVVSCLFHIFNSFTFRIGIFPYLSIALNTFFLAPAKVGHFFFPTKPVPGNQQPATGNRQLVIYGLGLYLFIQLLLPMRSWFYPGNVYWTEEGYRMSWKMMMREKKGTIHFKVVDQLQQVWIINPKDSFKYYHPYFIATSPDMIWQYAQRIKKEFAAKGFDRVEVYAIGTVSLNRRPARPLVDTLVDLAAVKWQPFRHSAWIMPFKDK